MTCSELLYPIPGTCASLERNTKLGIFISRYLQNVLLVNASIYSFIFIRRNFWITVNAVTWKKREKHLNEKTLFVLLSYIRISTRRFLYIIK